MEKPVYIRWAEPRRYLHKKTGYYYEHPMGIYRCHCGKEYRTSVRAVEAGRIKSCGCTTKSRKHGMSKSSVWNAWHGLRDRCLNPESKAYKYYGGKGVIICDRWLGEDGFQHFYDDMGEKPTPKHSIDRINSNGNYEPGNCRWATWEEQQNNKTGYNRIIEYKGVKQTSAQWARMLGTSRETIGYRIKAGWTAEQIIETPITKCNYRINKK